MNMLVETNIKLLNISILLVRIVVGIILFVSGSGKLLGWFGGIGLEEAIKNFSQMGIVSFWAYVSIFTEFVGGLFLIAGILTRLLSVLIFINMLVAFIFSIPLGIFSTALPFALMLNSVAIFLSGPMKYSVDYYFFKDYEI